MQQMALACSHCKRVKWDDVMFSLQLFPFSRRCVADVYWMSGPIRMAPAACHVLRERGRGMQRRPGLYSHMCLVRVQLMYVWL
jgi:hypothetical protein